MSDWLAPLWLMDCQPGASHPPNFYAHKAQIVVDAAQNGANMGTSRRETDMTTDQQLSAIARDMEACEMALAILKPGKLRRRYQDHLKACKAEIDRLCPIDPETAAMTTDELLAALTA
jgi:hypothetical protein